MDEKQTWKVLPREKIEWSHNVGGLEIPSHFLQIVQTFNSIILLL